MPDTAAIIKHEVNNALKEVLLCVRYADVHHVRNAERLLKTGYAADVIRNHPNAPVRNNGDMMMELIQTGSSS